MELSDKARGFSWAMVNLLDEKNSRRPIPGYSKVHLPKHPFGFEPPRVAGWPENRLWLVGSPAYTEMSVRGMHYLVGEKLGANHAIPNILRIYRTDQTNMPQSAIPWLVFEIKIFIDTLISSGCAEGDGGEGVSGGKTMENLMSLLEHIYDVPIEHVTVPWQKMEEIHQQLCDVLYERGAKRGRT